MKTSQTGDGFPRSRTSRMRFGVLAVLALVVVAAGAVAVGVGAYTRARADALDRAAATVRINGEARDCGPHRAVTVSISHDGPEQVRFAVDGAEVPSRRLEATGTDQAETDALLPATPAYPRCDDATPHRYQVLTTTPQGCRWAVSSQQTQVEALGHQWALQAAGGDCTLTLD